MRFIDDTLELCEDVVSVPFPSSQKEMDKEGEATFLLDQKEIQDTVSKKTDIFAQEKAKKITLSILDDNNNTLAEFETEDLTQAKDPLPRPQSTSSFCSDYLASLLDLKEVTQTSKRIFPSTSSQKSKKRKSDSMKDESDTFFQNLASVLDSKSVQPSNPQQDKVLEELMSLVKQLLYRQNDLLVPSSEADFFLRSLKTSLEFFNDDKRAFEIVKFRIQKVIIEAMDEFKKDS